MHLTAYPRSAAVSSYNLAIERMVEKLKQQEGVLSIFQIGNTNNPGISDIDMLVVLEDEAKCNLNPLENLSKTDRYLFSHSLYGISKTSFSQAHRYTFFHNYNLLWGEELPSGECDLSVDEIQALKTQIALEYLVKMYVNMTVRSVYGIFSVIGLLRHVKAMKYDLEFLNISTGGLLDLIETLVSWRDHWFENKPTTQVLKIWIDDFYKQLSEFLRESLKTTKFYLPGWANLRIARNITLVPSDHFGYVHKGITLPYFLGGLGRKYFNIQHRFNNFNFQITIISQPIPGIIEKRFEFLRQLKDRNNIELPHFMSMNSSLNIP